jgi:2-octaprenyl-6-methoxyphenol hydroxylase
LEQKADCVSLHFKQGGNVQAKLVLAADGTDSSIRKLLGIEADITDYQQTAIIANVKLKENHQYIAYERFSPEGPIAMLPLPEQQVAMIWTMAPELAAKRLALDNSAFLSALQQAFGYRLGRFVSIGQRFSFPLRLVTAKAQQQNRVLLFGNAAHSLHPIAGQGFNLTIRDIALLAEVLSQDPTCSPESLQRYVTVRAKEQKQMLQVTDGLVRLFAHSTGPIACLRDLGLYQFERLPWLKNHFNRMMMGKSGRLPRLARGLSLLD